MWGERIAQLKPRFFALAGMAALAGCSNGSTTQLERVAKDWALTIRASQIIPTYPLSEDIQPGDVFLVSTPLSKQVQTFEEKGFLPLDQLLVRLGGLGYGEFYKDGYWKGTYGASPFERPGWPSAEASPPVHAPMAGFPSYSFEVDRTGGLQLALPVKGIPLALGMMNATRATGTITIADANTYAIDTASLYRTVTDWYNSSNMRPVISAMAASNPEIYLRVVSRVYLTQKVNVSLANADATQAGLDAGAAQKVNAPDSPAVSETLEATEARYKAALDRASEALNSTKAMSGGSVRVTQVTSRSVSLAESFSRPLVIGYLAFDIKVMDDGELSAPIPSFSIASGNVTSFPAIQYCTPTPLMHGYSEWLRDRNNFHRMREWLDRRGIELNPVDLANDCASQEILREAQPTMGYTSKPNPARQR